MDKLTLGLSTTVIGMLVVFFGLVILIACIYVMTSITGRKSKKPAPVTELKKAPLPVPAPAVEESVQEAEDDGALVAAITAAVALIWESEKNQSGFVVRRIRRVSSGNARARVAREEQIFSRM